MPLKAAKGERKRAIWRMDNTTRSAGSALPRMALYQPDIPQNTGTILRLCACLGVAVDVIQPTGFDISDRSLKRAALDYLDEVELRRHTSWTVFEQWRRVCGRRLVLLTTRADHSYLDHAFSSQDILLLGRESAGVPDEVRAAAEVRLKVPMRPRLRSLNIAVTAAMVLGEAMRQLRHSPDPSEAIGEEPP